MPLYEAERHERLIDTQWNEDRARDAIDRIVADANRSFSAEGLWPIHPLDRSPERPPDSIKFMYHGAAGVIWALDCLNEAGAVAPERDYLLQRSRFRNLISRGKSLASRQFGYRPMVRSRYLLMGCLIVLSVIFLSNDPSLAIADGIVWAKKAVAIRDGCYEKNPQKFLSPNGKVAVEVLCRAIYSNGDRARYLRITDSAGRTNDAEFEDQLQRGDEILWSPDSTAFLVNGSVSSFSGNYVNIFRFGARGVEKLDVTEAAQRDMVLSFPPCKAIFDEQPDCHVIEKNPEYNMSAIDWISDKSAIVVMAEVPCSSSYGGIMCQLLGYELEVPTGKILSRMTATQLKKKWQSSMNWKMNIPTPPEYGRPK